MRVLLAYDGSESADKAIELVAGASWPPATEVRVVTAYQPIIPGEMTTGEVAAQLFDAQQEDAERLANAARGRIGRPGLTAASEVWVGRSASVILEAAERFGAELLVVGSRGRGAFTSALLGSVSEELVDHAACPVLVARGPGLTRVLLADDGSPDARAAADLVMSWPIFQASQVRVVSVAEAAGEEGQPSPMDVVQGRCVGRDHAPTARRVGASVCPSRPPGRRRIAGAAGLTAQVGIRQGDPAEAIVADAAAWPADLIAIGTRGQTGLTRLLRGSVARKVLQHAHCSVLIQRARSAG